MARLKLGNTNTVRLNLRVDAAQLARWREAAARARMTLSEWVRTNADRDITE